MKRNRSKMAWIFIAPALSVYLIFFIYPSTQAFFVSFFEWSGFSSEKKFIGIRNFIEISGDESFLMSLNHTLLILIVGGISIFLIAFIFSIFLNSGIKGKKIYRNIIFFPLMIAQIIHAIYWGLLVYNPKYGMINSFFRLVGIESLEKFMFLDSKYMFWSVLFTTIWIFVGFYVIILMAALERIPPYLYEAARLEGANEFQLFFRITLPLINPVLFTAIVFWGIGAIKMFDLFMAFGGVGTPRELWTNAIYTYLMGFGQRVPVYRLGYASALGLVMVILVIIYVIIIKVIFKREAYEY